jgi:arylsulfatase A-like enzyme
MGEFTPYAQRGIRNKDWLYVRHKDRRIMLHKQRNDPDEQHNLIDDPTYSTMLDDFDARITAHMEARSDDWDMAADFPPQTS